MLTIKLENVDKLDNFCRELAMITFFEELILEADYMECGKELNFVRTYAKECLHQKQVDTILELREFLKSEDFIQKIVTHNTEL